MDVGMMPFLLGDRADAVRERERLRKVGKRERSITYAFLKRELV